MRSWIVATLVLAPVAAYGCASTYGDAEAPAADAGDAGTTDATDASIVDGAEPDAGPACDQAKPFGTPTPVPGLATPEHEGVARFTQDELSVYFAAIRGDAGHSDLYVATRSARGAAFTGEQPVGGLNTPQSENDPTTGDDGLGIIFARRVDQTWSIQASTRPNTSAPFYAPIKIGVYFPGDDSSGQPYVLPEALYFTGYSSASGTKSKIRRSAVAPNVISPPVALPELESSSTDCNPTVTLDELTIYFCSDRPAAGARGKLDLYVARRASKTDRFSNVRPVEELNTSADEIPDWISSDGCRLYFTSDRVRGDGSGDVYVAERGR